MSQNNVLVVPTMRFFLNRNVSADITRVNEKLITNFFIILILIYPNKNINLYTLNGHIKETGNLYLQLYGWYFMPTSVQKLLVHGIDVIYFFGVFRGQQSLDSAKRGCNKLENHQDKALVRI